MVQDTSQATFRALPSEVPRLPPQAAFDNKRLPLVSIIVVNFNYADYLTEAVASVMGQTYPHTECVVVDDASTDSSPSVLSALERQYPDLRVIRRSQNGGQTAASLDGIAKTTGSFILFLDADDYLYPSFIETHVAVHLSLRFAAGFTCCDMVHLYRNAALSTSDPNISRYLASRHRAEAPIREWNADDVTRGFGLRAPPPQRIFSVSPSHHDWPWSAMSAIVFRRDAVELFTGAKGLKDISRCTDAYFCRGINAICGSVLIDLPLVVYRLHGKNAHFARAPLHHTVAFDRDEERDRTKLVVDRLIAHVVAESANFDKVFFKPTGYWNLLRNLTYRRDIAPSPRRIILDNFTHLKKTFGALRLLT